MGVGHEENKKLSLGLVNEFDFGGNKGPFVVAWGIIYFNFDTSGKLSFK